MLILLIVTIIFNCTHYQHIIIFLITLLNYRTSSTAAQYFGLFNFDQPKLHADAIEIAEKSESKEKNPFYRNTRVVKQSNIHSNLPSQILQNSNTYSVRTLFNQTRPVDYINGTLVN